MEWLNILSDKVFSRFHKKTIISGDCWLWLDKPDKRGYGRMVIKDQSFLAHYVAFVIYNKRYPTSYLQHSCNNALCVNPAHIYEGKNKGRPKS